MKRGKMKQLLVLILTGMLAVQSAGMPVFGVETGNTAFETFNEEEDVTTDFESADDEAAYEPQEASNDADEVTTGEIATEAESDANMPNEYIAEDENSAAGAGSTEAASEYLNDGDNVTRDEPEEDTGQNNTTSHKYPPEDENMMADVGGTETASEYANPVIDDEDEKIEQYTVTLDAKGGFFVNEWDDILNESVEKAEIINKVIYPGEAVYVIPVWEQENVVAKFIGWSLEPDGEIVSKEQEQFVPVENCVLYAVWKYEEISPDKNVSNATDVSETVQEDVFSEDVYPENVSEENVSPEEAPGEELNESVEAEVPETASDSKGEDIRESDVEEASANTTALDENIDKEKPGHTVNEKDNEESVSCDPMLSSIPEASNHMWYQYKGDIDIRGYTGSSTIQTTYSNRGYSTVLQCDGNKDTLMFYNNEETVSHSSGLTVTPNIEFSSDGKYVIVRYTVKNTSSSAKTYSLGVCADVDIDSDDHASVYRTNNGLCMVDRSTNRTYYLVCKNISGETSAGTLWFGYYGNRFENIFNDTSEVELTGVDSGMAFSWKDQIIPAGETASYVYQIGIGEAGAIVDYSEEENDLLHIDKTYQGMVGESVAVSATFISDGSPQNAVWTANDNTISFSGTSILGPFEGEKGNEYYLSTTATAQKAGYYDITLEVDGKTAHSTLFIANRSEDKGRLTITSGPITLETGRKYVVKAAYYDEAGNLAEAAGGIYWSTISGKNNGGEVNIKVVSDYYEYCLCEVTGVKAGTCGVFANTQSGLSVPVTFYVVNSAPAQKERVVSAQPTGHLSGSKNYDLAQTEQGTIDLSAPITSTVTIDARSVYSAAGDIEIKNKGELIVQGKLNAQKINVRTGGKLTVSSSGHLNASEIVADGGGWVWQEGGAIKILFGGVLKTYIISVKGDGMLSMEDNSQLIAYQDFSYNAHETKSIAGTLYIGGSMDVGKSFKAPDSGFVTVFYNDPPSCTFSFHEKSRLGTVYAGNAERYNAIGLSPDNITAAIRYFKVEKTNTGAWSYTPSNEKLETNWEQEVGAWYRNLAKARETVICLDSYPGLSSEDCDFVSRLADIWVTSVSGQVLNKGFIETSSATYDLTFKLRNKEYKIRYSPFTSGAYANYGSVTFGDAENEKMIPMGLTAAASTENFWSQATAYLAENRVKEYYQFVKGSLPKGKSEASLKGLLKKKGREFAEKYIDKVVEKYLFSTLKETGKSAEVKQIEKSFKVSKIVLNGDIEGLWKFVADEAKGTVSGKKPNSAQPAQTRTVNTAAGNEPESLSTEKKDTSSLDETPVAEGAMGTNESGGETDFNQIEITDEFLKSALVDILGADADGNPDFSRQEEIEFLDLSGRYIQSLQGIQNFSGLKTLILENNEIADLEPLHDMTGLQYLDVSGQNITDISVISGLVNLVYLDISDNDIETLTGVENLTALKELIISDTRISSFATLENLETLQLLRASG
ncbi:MAG: hypothetical protein Q4D71_08315, partial [Oscillospiraceae bacterium]|nr:hypothetical protein [Oscillospiraceae bacterium]